MSISGYKGVGVCRDGLNDAFGVWVFVWVVGRLLVVVWGECGVVVGVCVGYWEVF